MDSWFFLSFTPADLILGLRVGKRRRTQRGNVLRLIQIRCVGFCRLPRVFEIRRIAYVECPCSLLPTCRDQKIFMKSPGLICCCPESLIAPTNFTSITRFALLAPGRADLHSLAALSSTRPIEIDSCAPRERDEVTRIK